jgi:hypothetical protein
VVLDDVPDRAGLVVEGAPSGDGERLGHRDLNALHVRAVQQRLDDRVREPDERQVRHRVQAQPVVDPVDSVLAEVGVHGGVQPLCAGQVMAERLLHHDPVAVGVAHGGDALRDAAEQGGRDLQIEQHPLGVADRIRHRLIRRRIREVAVHVAEQAEHAGRGGGAGVHRVQLQRGDGVVPELPQAPARFSPHRSPARPAPRARRGPPAPGRSPASPDRRWHRRSPARRHRPPFMPPLRLPVTSRRHPAQAGHGIFAGSVRVTWGGR